MQRGGAVQYDADCMRDNQASSNVNLMAHAMRHFLGFNANHLDSGVLLLAVYHLCGAHQAQLACKSQLARLGGLSDSAGKFLTGIFGAAHIFNSSVYFIRIFSAVLHLVSDIVILLPLQAAMQGITPMSDTERAHLKILLQYLMRWILKKQDLPKDILEAIDCICDILNALILPVAGATVSQRHFTHVCDPCGCACRKHGATRVELVLALRTAFKKLFMRQPRVGSESRWASVTPCSAYFAAWGLLNNMAYVAMALSFDKPAEVVEGVLQNMLSEGMDWAIVFRSRLSKALHCLGHPDTTLHCLISVICIEPVHQMLFLLLKLDAKKHPELLGSNL